MKKSDYQTDGGELETSVSVRQLRLACIILVLLSLALLGNPNLSHFLPGTPRVHATPNAKIAINPPSLSLLGQTSGQVAFTVNLTGAPAINGFTVVLTYNTTVLKPVPASSTDSHLDFANNVLCPANDCTPTQVRNCVAGQGPICKGDDTDGIIALGLVLLSTITTAPTSGKLFTVTFNILRSGFSEVHILSATLTNGDLSQVSIPSDTFDGYFTNIDCPSGLGRPCTPPIVDFTASPTPADLAITGGLLLQGKTLIFNASARSTNPGASILTYRWIWGDGTLPQHGPNSTITHVYAVDKNYTVSLTATDTSSNTLSVSASRTKVFHVINNLIDLAVDSATANQDSGVTPGSVITVTARVLNNGTSIENATFTISVEGRLIGNTTFQGMIPHSRQEYTTTWNTANYSPRVYRIDAFVNYVRNPKNHTQIIEGILGNNLLSVFIQLVTPLPSGLSLSLLPSAGISILVLVGAGAAGSRLLRKRPVDTELP